MTGPDFQKHPPPPPPGYGPPPPGYGPPPPGYGYPAPYPAVEKPTGWFIVNWLFFWPTAIYSLVSHWNNIDRDLYYGNLAGAQQHARAVRKHGIIALCISAAFIVLWLILVLTLVTSVTSHCTTFNGGASCG